MGVGSFIELYLGYYAWGFYNVLWELFLHFGIVFIPFGYYLFEAFTEQGERGRGKKIAEATLNRIKMKIVIGTTVLLLAGLPVLPLQHSDMAYNTMQCNGWPAATRTVTKYTGGNTTGTTWDSFNMTGGSTLTTKVPAWWWAIISISQAISDGFKVKIPCEISLRDIQYEINTSRITDPNVRQEIGDFIHSCYRPVTAHFQQENPSSYSAGIVSNTIEENDIGWIGSNFFLTESGYYDSYRSDKEVVGFPYQSSGREQGEHSPGHEPTYGRPTCQEWYNGNGTHPGIRQKIINTLDASTLTEIKSWLASKPIFGGDQTKAENVLIRSLVDVNQQHNIRGSSESTWPTQQNGLETGLNDDAITTRLVANLGTTLAQGVFYPTLHLLKAALPIVHAFVLFGLIFLIPFLLIMSNYGIKEMLAFSALIMAVKFWPAIWEVGHFFEANLVDALTSETSWMSLALTTSTDNVIEFVIGAWYMFGPALLTLVMTIAGFRVGNAISSAMNQGTQQSQSAGQQGGRMAMNTATGAGKSLKGK